MSGAEVASQIKADPQTANTPVILLSASNDGLDNPEIQPNIADKFLKPVDHNKLLESIQKHTGSEQ